MAEHIAIQVRIEGRVQGIWFRGWTIDQATSRDLAGWVRNRGDGTVEALFAGPEAAVRDMLAACRQGPRAAHVTNVIEIPAAMPDGATGFVQLPTA